MKQLQSSGVLIAGAALSLLMSQPAWAVATRVTGVRLNPTDRGLNVILETASGDRPQVFTGTRGNALVADVINTQLNLSQGNNFRQNNPAPGIASVVITRLDANSIRLVITGTSSAPTGQITQRSANNLTLSFSPAGTASTTPAAPASVTAAAPSLTASPSPAAVPSSTTSPSPAASPLPTAPAASPQPQLGPGQTPGLSQQPVLVPNPQITIDGKPAPAAGTAQPVSTAPPFLPRAVAPPVGDVAISNIDASPSVIDLGTVERVPRLVLRDAPVREVLALLARAASLNLVFTEAGAQTRVGQPAAATSNTVEGPTISLDVENESVQDTFNNVLRLSGLEANRSGRTIFVGTKLPNEVRDTVVRSLRLNQVTVGVALNLLVGLGAESAVSRDRQITTVSAVPVGGGAPPATTTQTTTETRLETQRVSFQDSRQLLVGLEALGDERTNSVTLIGTAKQVDVATAQLVRLDGRRRQVAVNVKVVDVNLSASDLFNSSFSFGIGNNFFTNSNGTGVVNVGGSRPPTATEAANATTSPPVVQNQYNGTPFINPNQPIQIQGASPGTTVINNSTAQRVLTVNGVTQTFSPGVTFIPATGAQQTTTFQPISPASNNPLQPGFTNITQPTQNTVTIDQSGNITSSQGTAGTTTTALPSLFQFPSRFLATLQASVTTGNAKILTDPTLIVQEGQVANVNLTQQVVGNIATQTNFTAGAAIQTVNVTKEQVGLTLSIRIERIDDNGFVSLSVAPVVRAPQASQTINLGQGNTQTIVLINERSLNSGLIRLRDSQTLVLSGIIQDQDQTSVTKIPILGDIPILGALFRSTNRTNQRQEVIVLLTPQILDDSDRSTFGYNYTPSPEVRQILERRGLTIPQK